jgi:hypothetical protein
MRIVAMLVVALGGLWLSSCGGGSDSITLGEYCDSTGMAFCHRAETCAVATLNACFQDFKQGCCINDGTCGEVVMNSAALRTLETNCDAALSTEACTDVSSGTVPPACLMSP